MIKYWEFPVLSLLFSPKSQLCSIPFNIEEWDSGKGNAQAHRLRMEANATEKQVLKTSIVFL